METRTEECPLDMTTLQDLLLAAQWGQKPDGEDSVGTEKANTAYVGNFEKLDYNIMKFYFLFSITSIFKQNVTQKFWNEHFIKC